MTSIGRSKYGKILGVVSGAMALLALTSPPRPAAPGAAATLTAASAPAGPMAPVIPGAAGTVSPVTQVSRCPGQNAEVETATWGSRYVYDLWIGCGGIGFARSTDGGAHFGSSVTVPGSAGFSWDPSIAVGPAGVVYLAFMHQANHHMYPTVDASFDKGASFPQVSPLVPAKTGNWGDRDFIAVSGTGVVYLTWDYGPSAAVVKLLCSPTGSCAFKAGDMNSVFQRSLDGGKTWGPITPVGPHFPIGGGYSAPVVAGPAGHVYVLSWGHHIDSPPSYKLHPGHEFFTASADEGSHWPAQETEMGASAGSIALPTWWIDGDLSQDQGGNLYTTWDTQTASGDVGWLSFSTNGGTSWSSPVRVTPDKDTAVHIVQVLGGPAGVAYVGWQTDASPRGYATFVRPYSITKGWLGPAVQVSSSFGSAKIWPGDTFGIAPLAVGSAAHLTLSWGSAIDNHKNSEIYAATVTLLGAAAAKAVPAIPAPRAAPGSDKILRHSCHRGH